MKLKRTKMFSKSESSMGTIVTYTVASIIGLIAIASLVNNIIIFKAAVAQYVAQGYPSAQVVQQLIPSQLLPGLFEPIAVYGGIAFILFGVGIISHKVSKCLNLLAKAEVVAVENNNEHEEDVEQISKAIDETEQH
ncbi:MAG TPA: hypothetical protein VMW83_02895 [Spirochaetia bacterium]|nr:hypothetical protein [Spirochaetia bacterium]